MATIQLGNTKVANKLISYAEKRAEEREGSIALLTMPRLNSKLQGNCGAKQTVFKPTMSFNRLSQEKFLPKWQTKSGRI